MIPNPERPARMVGLFTLRALQPGEMERLVGACHQAIAEQEPGAALTLHLLSDLPVELQRTWRVSVTDAEDATPHDCYVQCFSLDDPASPHRSLLDQAQQLDQELGKQATAAAKDAQSYLTISSGRLDDPIRVHPFLNLVSLLATALGAWIIDPAAAVVSMDPAEWADCCEMSLSLEQQMGILKQD